MSTAKDGTTLTAGERMPAGVPLTIAVERPEEFCPGLDPELTALIQATADLGTTPPCPTARAFGIAAPPTGTGSDSGGLLSKVKDVC